MIALMMFLFLSGGAKKAKPNQCLFQAGYNVPTIWRDCSTIVAGGDPSLHATQMDATDGSKAVKLSDDEYSHLQDLRKAVADEEQRLAVKYGAYLGQSYNPANAVMITCDRVGGCMADHYEYHGQFLLIEKSNGEKK